MGTTYLIRTLPYNLLWKRNFIFEHYLAAERGEICEIFQHDNKKNVLNGCDMEQDVGAVSVSARSFHRSLLDKRGSWELKW